MTAAKELTEATKHLLSLLPKGIELVIGPDGIRMFLGSHDGEYDLTDHPARGRIILAAAELESLRS